MTNPLCGSCKVAPVDDSSASSIRRGKCRGCYRRYMARYMARRRQRARDRALLD